MKHLLSFVIGAAVVSLLAGGCAAPRYETPQPLTAETVKSLDGNISANVPEGWFAATDSVVAPQLLLWFVRDDYAATMGLREINVEPDERKRIEEDGIKAVAEVSLALKRLHSPDGFRIVAEPETFKRRGEKYASYEYAPNGKDLVRVIVFAGKGRYYEFSTLPLSERGMPEDTSRLFSTQQSVFVSMRW